MTIATATRRGHDGVMTRPARGAVASWGLATGLVVAVTATGSVLAALFPPRSGDPSLLSSSLAWQLFLPLAVLAALATVLLTRARGHRPLARWMFAATAATAGYHLASGGVAALAAHDATTANGIALLLALTIAGGAWTLVLALLQATALAAAEAALGRPFGRNARRALVAAASFAVVAGVLFSTAPAGDRYAHLPWLLPPHVAAAPIAQGALSVIVYGWMLSLLATPIALWIAAARERGPRRSALARVALGSVVPVLVVMLCGLLAAFLWAGTSTDLEAHSLSIGFCLALPATLGWLSATVRAATSSASPRVTALSFVVRAGMWLFCALAIVQIAAPLAGAFGGGAAWGALVATLLIAVTAVPWALLVRWCVRKIDPRAAVAAAVIAGDRTHDPAAQVAERALRDALGDPGARVLLARRDGRWIDAWGDATDPPPLPGEHTPIDQATAQRLTGADGSPLAALVHGTRFIDTRPLAAALRPLLERASLEADLREEAARATAERRRADVAAVQARARIERDLHDGVQGRLVSLGLDLSLARAVIDDPTARLAIEEAVSGLQSAVRELRAVSHGTLSESLTERGLAAALGELVGRTPVEVSLTVADVSLDADARTVAYFVVAEAVTNAVKHAAPGHVGVAVHEEGGVVVVSVSDDGCGGADMRAGTGLRGLSERVHAVGGRLVVSEGVPHGTVLEAVLPCAS